MKNPLLVAVITAVLSTLFTSIFFHINPVVPEGYMLETDCNINRNEIELEVLKRLASERARVKANHNNSFNYDDELFLELMKSDEDSIWD